MYFEKKIRKVITICTLNLQYKLGEIQYDKVKTENEKVIFVPFTLSDIMKLNYDTTSWVI